jgi:hypothetical protein
MRYWTWWGILAIALVIVMIGKALHIWRKK